MTFKTPEEYVRACEEAYEICGPLPHPETIEQFLALDDAHPPTLDRMGWADCVSVPTDWYAKRKPEPSRFAKVDTNTNRTKKENP